MRFRVTIRDNDMELRGYVDGEDVLRTVADDMHPTQVIASPAADDYNPFGISQPEYPPTLDSSIELISEIVESAESPEDLISTLAQLHLAQAIVIRGERYQRESAEQGLLDRELYQFEAEHIIARIKAARSNHPDLPVCEKYPDPEDFVKCGWRSAVEEIDKVLEEIPE